MGNLYRLAAKLMPGFIKKRIKLFLGYSGIKVEHESFLGFVTTTSLLLGLAAGFGLGHLLERSFWMLFGIVTGGTNFIIYIWLILQVDKKARLVEESLPDALQLMTSNLRAGMTPEKALLLSSRPEFGPLKDEIDIVGKKVTLGTNIGSALSEMAKRVRSKRLVRAVELINSGLDSGGNLATLLEATAGSLRDQFLVDKKIKASITMYLIFIFSVSSVISPVIFGLISFLVEVVQASFAGLESTSGSLTSLPIQVSTTAISIEFLMTFIIIFIIINTFMSSLLLGLIGKGRQREGVRYFIPMILLAVPLFFIARGAISSVLSGLFGL
jgi:archaellum biogenesis protein FlaJ (TadC family)